MSRMADKPYTIFFSLDFHLFVQLVHEIGMFKIKLRRPAAQAKVLEPLTRPETPNMPRNASKLPSRSSSVSSFALLETDKALMEQDNALPLSCHRLKKRNTIMSMVGASPSLTTAGLPIESLPDPLNSPALQELNENVPTVRQDDAIEQMNMLSYTIRDQITKESLADTTTARQYDLYLKDYIKWWDKNEYELLQQNQDRHSIPAMPITPAKVVLFLNYTMKRPRRTSSGIDIPGTTVGRSTIQSTINALEAERSRNVYLYPNDKDTQISLRSDDRIKKLEFAAKHNEPSRILSSQIRKATGTSADTYTREQMIDISLTCLEATTSARFATAVRDRALYLVPLSTAFRGDNVRSLALSDLFSKPVKNMEAGVDKEIMCLRILCDNAKHNQSGKVEEQGAIRHRFVELCSIGALALHFFMQFQVADIEESYNWSSEFSTEAQTSGFGIYGRRDWWHYKVFPGDGPEGKSSTMTYNNHAKRILALHNKAGAVLSKVTHAQRYSAAFVMRAHGTAKQEARAIGWSCADAYNAVYDRELPLEALLGAAMFNARKPEAHFCARDLLEPPSEIMAQIFPWIEHELQALKVRIEAHRLAADLALEGFLGLLKDMRRVLIQDLAVLYERVPQSYIYTCPPFNTSVFREFAVNSSALLEESESNAQLALKNLPENVAKSFEGAVQLMVKRQLDNDNRQAHRLNTMFETGLAELKGVIEYMEPPKKRRKGNFKKPSPLQTSTNATGSLIPDSNVNVNSAQSIRSMFTAPIIPIAVSYRSHVETHTFDGERPVTLIPRPDNVIGSLRDSSNTLSEALQDPISSVPLPQLDISSQIYPRTIWEPNWVELTGYYNIAKLLKHTWEWREDHLIPHYDFQKITTFEELWKEYTEGLNGYLPFREIKERWAANPAWHRNKKTKKNEFTRRKKTIDFIEKLSKTNSWTVQKALKFLTERYGDKVVGTFMRDLATDTLDKIMTESEQYF